MYEGFVPYENIDQAKANLSLSGKSNVFDEGNNKNSNKGDSAYIVPGGWRYCIQC